MLAQGLAELGIDCSEVQRQQLLAYVQLLAKWNKVYNLTAVRELLAMVTRHILDSLSVLPYLEGDRVLDVGSGAGLPGIPLAIVCPSRQFVLLDSNSKKTRFMQQAVNELGLQNVTVVHARSEDFQPSGHAQGGFDVVLSRAFASIPDMLHSSGRHCAEQGVILAMKGEEPVAELQALPEDYEVEAVHSLVVPGLDEVRHLVCLRRQNK
jgi:16S rRNA (guanine527-N7)-methyltransferase